MRFMLTIRVPMDKGNALVKSGTLPDTVQSVMADIKPEAVYFSVVDGLRGGYAVVNLDDASQLPALLEPLFLGMGATVDVVPVMSPEDLGKAGPAIQQAGQKYG
jgi:hypothetical protein